MMKFAFQDLLEEVETVFQSPSCLNGSLLKPDHSFCSSKNSGIDLGAWRNAYRAIEKCSKDTLKARNIIALRTTFIKHFFCQDRKQYTPA